MTEHFLGQVGFKAKDLIFETKDFKMCPRGQGRPWHVLKDYTSVVQEVLVF